MQKITISIDEYTLSLIDWVAARYSLDRSSAIRAICRAVAPYMNKRAGEYGVQTSSGEDTERA